MTESERIALAVVIMVLETHGPKTVQIDDRRVPISYPLGILKRLLDREKVGPS